jgi:hypothetical protein
MRFAFSAFLAGAFGFENPEQERPKRRTTGTAGGTTPKLTL